MFVSKSKYEQAILEVNACRALADGYKALYFRYSRKYDKLLDEWNALIEKINAKGGEAFLNKSDVSLQFSDEDLKRLLMLCHPDKHDGKQMAIDMTQKLIAMRKGK